MNYFSENVDETKVNEYYEQNKYNKKLRISCWKLILIMRLRIDHISLTHGCFIYKHFKFLRINLTLVNWSD